MLNGVSGNTVITLPEEYEEIYAIANYYDGTIIKSSYIHLPKIVLSSQVRYFADGGYWSDGNAYGIYYETSEAYIKLNSFFNGGVEHINDATLHVYYR